MIKSQEKNAEDLKILILLKVKWWNTMVSISNLYIYNTTHIFTFQFLIAVLFV